MDEFQYVRHRVQHHSRFLEVRLRSLEPVDQDGHVLDLAALLPYRFDASQDGMACGDHVVHYEHSRSQVHRALDALLPPVVLRLLPDVYHRFLKLQSNRGGEREAGGWYSSDYLELVEADSVLEECH